MNIYLHLKTTYLNHNPYLLLSYLFKIKQNLKSFLVIYINNFSCIFYSGSWEIILCHTCGSSGTHILCSSLKCDQKWFCTACQHIAGITYFTLFLFYLTSHILPVIIKIMVLVN